MAGEPRVVGLAGTGFPGLNYSPWYRLFAGRPVTAWAVSNTHGWSRGILLAYSSSIGARARDGKSSRT